ncbi:hypothetical protein Gpo141_00001266 [Globisporangium polare]
MHLLHMTECILLVEYTEVMIPMVYCLYLLIVGHLSNRVYNAQLKDLSDAQLTRNIANILLYALLELVSILVLGWLLARRRSGVSSVHLLTFVLENQWQMVQAKLVLWVVVAVQTSL